MFCHDGTTIFYPTGPGRVHMITISALADCDGSDEDLSDSTSLGDLGDMMRPMGRNWDTSWHFSSVVDEDVVPASWPDVYIEEGGILSETPDVEAAALDFHDALEQWADWCDRDSARLDSLDAIMGAVEAA